MKTIKNHLASLLVLPAAIIFVWYKILETTFISEGYFYFAHGYFSGPYWGFDAGARLLFEILKRTFRDNMLPYNIFLLAVLLFLTVLFYFFVLKVTRNKFIAFIASIIFSTNYWTLVEYFGYGAYQTFSQRLVWFLLLFPSFIFFVDYLKSNKPKYLMVSLLFYSMSIYLGAFSVFFLPFYFTYLLGFYIGKKRFIKKDFKIVISTLFYVIVSFTILKLNTIWGSDGFFKDRSFLEFLVSKWSEVVDLVFRQLTIITIPTTFTHSVVKNLQLNYAEGVRYFYFPVTLLYTVISVYIFKKNKALIPIAIASLLFMPIAFVLNVYMREEYIIRFEEGSRYMFVPSIGFSIFWAVVLYSLFHKHILKFILLGFLFYWVITNAHLVSATINEYSTRFKATKISLNYIKSISSKFQDDSIVIVPSVINSHGADYVQYFYGGKHTFIDVYYSEWEKKIPRPFDTKKDFIIRYDYSKGIINDTNRINEILDERRKGIYSG